MKLNFKRFLTLALALIMVISMMPVGSALAAEEETVTIYYQNRDGWANVTAVTKDYDVAPIITRNFDTFKGYEVISLEVPVAGTGVIIYGNSRRAEINAPYESGVCYYRDVESDYETSNVKTKQYTPNVVKVEKPSVTVSPAQRDGAAFAVNFTADAMTTEQQNYYGSWIADLVLTVNKPLSMNQRYSTEYSYLSIYCPPLLGSESWVDMPAGDENIDVPANTPWGLLAYGGKTVTYNQFDAVGGVGYAVFFPESYLKANPGLEATVSLVLTNRENGETVTLDTHKYESPVKLPEMPEATVTRIFDKNLTFAMNFTAVDASEEQLAYYGDWYADFELVVNKDVTFDANGKGDGWLSGRYDAWNNGAWIKVPVQPVELKANKPIKIMELAAQMLGEEGLKFTYKEVLETVKNFDCGVYFTPEFLAKNSDLNVSLQLKMYDPAEGENAKGYEVSDSIIFTKDNINPTMPTATISKASNPNLTFAMNFKTNEVTEEQLEYFGDWYADFELTINKDVTFDANGGKDGYLSGSYEGWQDGAWVNVPTKPVTLEAGQTIKVMEFAAELLGEKGLKYTYREIYETVKNFSCGAYFTPEFLAANSDLEVTLELRMYNPKNENESYAVSDTYVFDQKTPAIPTATVTEIVNENLTFALNFKTNTVTAEQLEYYSNWYADFELTINKDVTFDANGGKDGYLSGSYEGWQDGAWVNVPFKDSVTLKAGETIKIMAFAAELMGEPGLKYTYKEIYESVKDFDCGIFFEPEFLAANPDLEVTLELQMYNPKDENETYVIGETYEYDVVSLVLPTATISKASNPELTFAMNFKADEVTDEQLEYFGEWFADFELTINKTVTFDANDTADGWLSGSYAEWNNGAWVNVPFEPVTLEAGQTIKVMEFAAELMGEPGLEYTYREIYEVVKNFSCGAYFTPEFLKANPNLEVTLELRMYNPEDKEESYAVSDTYVFNQNTPAIPTATVTEIVNENLTFALNFKADEVTAEQLAFYKNWYADFELTINKDVTFNAVDEKADGYLSGQYDDWNENWINVPFDGPVTLKAGETLKIMEFAAELMGEEDLKITYNDVYTSVKDFDCGVYFTPEFLKANPDLEVTLELRMYNPDKPSESYVIGKTYEFEAYAAQNVKTNTKYVFVQDALDAANEDDTVIVLRDSVEESLTLFKGVTLDLNGMTVSAAHASAFQGNYIIDSTNGNGLLKVEKGYVLLQRNNPYLPIYNGKDGYAFTTVTNFQHQMIEIPDGSVGTLSYKFLPHLNPEIHDLLLTLDSGVELKIEVSWKRTSSFDGKEQTAYQTFVYNREMVETVLDSYQNGRYNMIYTLALRGISEEMKNTMTFCVMFTSDVGVEVRCKPYVFNGEGA